MFCLLSGEDTVKKVRDFERTHQDAEEKLADYDGLHGRQNKQKNSDEHYKNLKKAFTSWTLLVSHAMNTSSTCTSIIAWVCKL